MYSFWFYSRHTLKTKRSDKFDVQKSRFKPVLLLVLIDFVETGTRFGKYLVQLVSEWSEIFHITLGFLRSMILLQEFWVHFKFNVCVLSRNLSEFHCTVRWIFSLFTDFIFAHHFDVFVFFDALNACVSHFVQIIVNF